MSDYIGKRIVPKHCGEWSKDTAYEMLSIVLHTQSGESYISRREVPAGTDILDGENRLHTAQYSPSRISVPAGTSRLEI